MGPGYVILISCVTVFLYFFLLYLIEFFTHLNYKIHSYTPPQVPMYYRYCPPPPPKYYLRLEYLESLPDEDEVSLPNKISTPLKN
jgi:hypothetical protein